MPIGLGMNHLEQEIAACHVWNIICELRYNPEVWLMSIAAPTGLFGVNQETGLGLENSGFIEVTEDRVSYRFTPKAIELLKTFAENQ